MVDELSHFSMNRIRENNIRLVCFDFDQTAYKGHTGGALDLEISKLAPTLHRMVHDLSQDFLAMVYALHEAHIHVAIVTFGDAKYNAISLETNTMILGGEPLIRPVLNMGLSRQTTEQIPIYALNPQWRNEEMKHPQFPESKQWHILQAMNHFGISESKEVLLIDDSDHNISEAASMGHRTILVSPEPAFELSQVLKQFY